MNVTALWLRNGVSIAIRLFPFSLAATSGSHALAASRRPSHAVIVQDTFTDSQPVRTLKLASGAGVEISFRVWGGTTDLLRVSCKY
jgi:hypothetical protein